MSFYYRTGCTKVFGKMLADKQNIFPSSENNLSKKGNVNCEFSHWSILDPFPFLLYIIYLPQAMSHVSAYLYVDDTGVFNMIILLLLETNGLWIENYLSRLVRIKQSVFHLLRMRVCAILKFLIVTTEQSTLTFYFENYSN